MLFALLYAAGAVVTAAIFLRGNLPASGRLLRMAALLSVLWPLSWGVVLCLRVADAVRSLES